MLKIYFIHLCKLFAITLSVIFVSEASSHQVRPTIINVDLTNNDVFKIRATLNFEALISGLLSDTGRVPTHSDQIEAYQTYRNLSSQHLQVCLDFG